MSVAAHEVPEALKQVIADVLRVKPEEIALSSSTKTVRNWDSLRHVELVVAIEERFKVSFGAAEVFALNSVQGFCDILARKDVDLYAT
jgi:acyl carrier protein